MLINAFCRPGETCPGYITQLLRSMRLTAFALLAFSLHVGARAVSQSITYSGKNVSLEAVFNAIEKQTGYVAFYDYRQIAGARPVTLDVKNEPLTAFLDRCFKDQPFGFSIENKTIIIKHKAMLVQIQADPEIQPSPPDIHGRVMDSTGNPLAGASVSIKGTKIVVMTDQRGNFTLKGPVDEARVIISYVGYVPREIEVNAHNSAFILNGIVLKHNDNPLDEVHVIAYGTESQRFSVGSNGFITSKDIEDQPVTNILQAMEGRVAGLIVTPSSGVPGSQVSLQIRGQNTIQNSAGSSYLHPYDQPMIFVDGVPFATQNNNINQIGISLSSDGTSLNGITGFTGLNGINPADIESISILKDADATSIYGTQGNNGVILITTKKGKVGKSSFNLDVNSGINAVAKPIKLLNTPQYLQMREAALQSDGTTITPANALYYPDLTVFDQNKYTNWYNQFFVRTPVTTTVNAQVSGGSVRNTYLVSGGYTHQDYNYPGNHADDRFTLHSNLHNVSQNNKLTLDFTSDFSYDHNNAGYFQASSGGYQLPPNMPNLLDSNGNLVWNYKGVAFSTQQFYASLKKTSLLEAYLWNESVNVMYKVLPGLNITAMLGYNNTTTVENQEIPANSQSPSINPKGVATFANGMAQAFNINPQINYARTIGKGSLSVLVGGTYRKMLDRETVLSGSNYANDNLLGSINAAPTVTASDSYSLNKYSEAFGRLTYIYDQKYILRLTGNRDGSSNFGPGRQFGNFWSGGLGWIFSEEQFFKMLRPVIGYAKLSGNYGTSGSNGVQPYQFQPFWGPIPNTTPFQGMAAYQPLNLYNPDYSWDNKRSLNLALDLGLFDQRLSVNATYYRNTEGNQLTSYPLPIIAGFSSVLENLNAEVQNTGWEFSLTSNNIRSKNISWSSTLNLTFGPSNKLLSFPGLENSSYANQYVVGMPTTISYLYRYKDVNPTTGLFEFYNAKGEVTSTPLSGRASQGGDQVPVAYNMPKFEGGLNNDFRYKRLTLTLFFQFQKETVQNWLYAAYGGATIPGGMANFPIGLSGNYWQNPGDNKPLERLTASYGTAFSAASSFGQSTGAYSSETFVRLKTLALSYNLPNTFIRKAGLTGCRLSVLAENLLTFTNYKMGDPEQPGSFNIIPLQRTVLCRISFNF